MKVGQLIRIHVRNTSKANSYCQGRVLKNLSVNYYLMEWLLQLDGILFQLVSEIKTIYLYN